MEVIELFIDMPRGDQFPVSFKVRLKDSKEYLTVEEVTEVTITCKKAPIKDSPIIFQKKLSTGDVTYEDSKFKFQILEEDTKNLQYGTYGFDIEVRAKNLISTKVGSLTITDVYTE